MLRFFLDSMYLPVVMLGDLDGFERFFVLIFSWQHCYRGYREVWGTADMNGSRELHMAHHEKRSVFTCSADAELVFRSFSLEFRVCS